MAANMKIQKRKLDQLNDIKKDPSSIMSKERTNHHKKLRVTFKGLSNTVYVSSPGEPRSDHYVHQRVTAPNSPPELQRSPSPTDDSRKQHELHLHQLQYEKQYENSPLLTPKDEDDDDESDDNHNHNNSNEVERKVYPNSPTSTACSTPPTSSPINDTNDSTSSNIPAKGPNYADLNTNPDYITLTSSLHLLNSTTSRISQEIVYLSNLRKFHENNQSKDEVIDFYMKLLNKELDLPKPSKVLKAPTIDWGRYHNSLSQVSKTFESQTTQKNDTTYKSLRLFEK